MLISPLPRERDERGNVSCPFSVCHGVASVSHSILQNLRDNLVKKVLPQVWQVVWVDFECEYLRPQDKEQNRPRPRRSSDG